MRRYFGTDGIRGKVNEDLLPDIAEKCGNALTQLKRYPTVVIGRDTRQSGDLLSMGLSTGIISGGGKVLDVGIMPTASVAFLTKYFKADYGVVISASHNPPEYNGIKIFGSDGFKLSEDEEEQIESCFTTEKLVKFPKFGKYEQIGYSSNIYIDNIMNSVNVDMTGLKVVLDCANGAAYHVAPELFRRIGADARIYNCENTGIHINTECGSLHTEKLCEKVVDKEAQIGFAFDGDSDRLIAVDEKGRTVNGDEIIYILATHMLEKGELNPPVVVGTHHTNMGIQRALEKKGITLLRSDIGDKYVMEMMRKEGCKLGGEQSGHIILLDLATTGDGILSACQLAAIIAESGKTVSELLKDVSVWPQCNVNIEVKDKIRLMNNENFVTFVDDCRAEIAGKGRVLVRASGTEPKIRIMTECVDADLAKTICDKIALKVKAMNM